MCGRVPKRGPATLLWNGGNGTCSTQQQQQPPPLRRHADAAGVQRLWPQAGDTWRKGKSSRVEQKRCRNSASCRHSPSNRCNFWPSKNGIIVWMRQWERRRFIARLTRLSVAASCTATISLHGKERRRHRPKRVQSSGWMKTCITCSVCGTRCIRYARYARYIRMGGALPHLDEALLPVIQTPLHLVALEPGLPARPE